MDGYEATRAIRALPGGGTLPILALTASAFEEDRPRMLEAGCSEILKKPFQEYRLFQALAEHLHVKYEYDRIAALPERELPSDAKPLACLDQETRQALKDAAVSLDEDRIRALADALLPDHPEAARHILALTEGYHFDHLAQQLDEDSP
jgi:DNA-binding response OmpR family regulator